ncbi:MAG: S8 family serine peptidase, partial [Candidatus Thermoplasmatota archaeon]
GRDFRVVGRFSPDVGILTWGTYSDFGLVRIRLDASYLVPIARLGAVRYIEPQEEMQLFNQQEQYVLQTNATAEGAGVRKIWDNGLRGDLQTIALSDTGLDYDHTMFRHDQSTVTLGADFTANSIYNTTNAARRKVIRYLTMSQYVGVDPWGTDPGPRKDGPDGGCGFGHGTATSAAAAGFDSTFTPASLNDGMAPNAKLVMMDIGRVDATACDDLLSYIPDDYADLFGPAYAPAPVGAGARIFSGSWGGTSSAYTTEARMV